MPQPAATAGTARAAADRFRDALDSHLAAVEARSGEHDPAVQLAYKELRTAAADYDLALYEEHDEVTPFDLPEPQPPEEDDDELDLDRLSLLARWDFSVTDEGVLLAAAEKAIGESVPNAGVALAAVLATAGHTRLGDPDSAALIGLRAHGHTSWILATDDADPDDDDPEWMDDAFGGADPDRVLCRLDAPAGEDDSD